MAVSNDYLAYVIEQLERVTRVTTRRMFGGVGIYADALFFALIDDDTLYFKVDDTNRPDFEAAGMGPFRPFGDAQAIQYYEVPADVLEDHAALGAWVAKAVGVARARAASARKATNTTRTTKAKKSTAKTKSARSGSQTKARTARKGRSR